MTNAERESKMKSNQFENEMMMMMLITISPISKQTHNNNQQLAGKARQ